ncbi:hypothetical protein KL86DYS2_12241 [uncultured Dysgonomonas sp.]|uniref:Uncharacterized protein n=1 Tax=uncultured Dysgonomonas sp. TaxID=206096 RepID=A0A212JSH0_9BACT|nr:hypothetical protein KL86DYS2_12241 [uncultured Dysgonomonas sp.]
MHSLCSTAYSLNININFSAWVVVAVVIATIWERVNMVYSSMPA